MDGLDYDNAVLLDTHRLWPLLLVVAAGAAFDTQAGAGVFTGAAWEASLLQLAALSLLKWGATVGALLGLVHVAMRQAIGGRVFTGTKWTVASLFSSGGDGEGGVPAPEQTAAAEAAKAAAERFLHQALSLLRTHPSHLEPPTVTRYSEGQQQRAHFDGRPAGDPSGLQEFMAAGGQRLVQVVCYLRTLQPGQGGETTFHHLHLGGLAVRPVKGDALIFFPAYEDGALDGRMAHSGAPVGAGAEKWIINSWACQRPTPGAVKLRAPAGPAAAAPAAAARMQ